MYYFIVSAPCIIYTVYLSLPVVGSPEQCYEGDVSLDSRSSVQLPYGPSHVTGRVTACVDNRYVDVCATSNETQYFADRACNSVGSSYSKFMNKNIHTSLHY